MTRKKYISTGACPLSIDIMDGDMLRTFDFRGGFRNPVFKPPSYSTEKVEEQELLESHSSFNVSFKLEEVFEQPAPDPIQEVAVMEELMMKEVSFRNVQEGKTWLNKEYGISFTKLNNKTKVIKEALDLGLNMLFETDNNFKN